MRASMKWLQTDHIDLYYWHRVNPAVSPEEVAEVMGGLIKERHISGWGFCILPKNNCGSLIPSYRCPKLIFHDGVNVCFKRKGHFRRAARHGSCLCRLIALLQQKPPLNTRTHYSGADGVLAAVSLCTLPVRRSRGRASRDNACLARNGGR